MKSVNLTYIIVALIFGVSVVSYGAFGYMSNQNQLYAEIEKNQMIASRMNAVNECLTKVEKDYKRKVELNSDLVPTKEYPDARRWHDTTVHQMVEDKHNKDRDFCLKLNK